MFYENYSYTEMMRMLWESKSNKITAEDRDWLDKISRNKRLKFSEGDKLMELMLKVFGPSN